MKTNGSQYYKTKGGENMDAISLGGGITGKTEGWIEFYVSTLPKRKNGVKHNICHELSLEQAKELVKELTQEISDIEYRLNTGRWRYETETKESQNEK